MTQLRSLLIWAKGHARALRLAVALVITPMVTTYGFTPAGKPAELVFDPINLGGLPEYRSHDGLLEAELVAAPMHVHVGAMEFAGLAYNGVYGGPVLRAHPGDEVRLHLVNATPEPINLHFHGLRITPAGSGDNMHVLVQPGARYTYEFRIPPNHPPGLFWYHDHAPERAERHVMSGLSGAFLVEGFAAQFPGLSRISQELLVLKDWTQPDCAGGELKAVLHCRVVSIDGQTDWRADMKLGDSQLWRISNQGANLILHLSLRGLQLQIVGRDGLPALDGSPTDTVDIMPASRLDVVVRPVHPGQFPIIATGVPSGHGDQFTTRRVLGLVNVAETAIGRTSVPIIVPHQRDLNGERRDAKRTVVFGENPAATIFTINGRRYDPSHTEFHIPLGTVEEWTIRNTTQDFHVFHIHQLGFQIVEINGRPQQFTGYVDGVRVPEMGSVKLLIPFTDPQIVGHIMFHCHVLAHEDHGMMAQVEVYRPGLRHVCLPADQP